MANLISPFTIDPLNSATGFKSPGFTVTPEGNLSMIGDITLDGNMVLSSGTIQSGASVLITPTALGSSIVSSNLTSIGTLTHLTVDGAVNFVGAINMSSTPVTGVIDNVNIGTNNPGIGTFTELNITETIDFNPSNSGVLNNISIGSLIPSLGKFTNVTATNVVTTDISISNDVQINGKLSVGGTNIKSLAIAMAVALS